MIMTNDSFKRRRLLSCSSSSAEIVGHNEDLVTQISLHLPVKSVIRFLSVSKQWKSLLTHPQFIHGYSSLHTGRNSLLFFGGYTFKLSANDHDFDIADFGYLPIPNDHYLQLERSCNGLLLFSTRSSHSKGGIRDTSYCYVCNPFTRKYRELAVPYYTAGVQPLSSYLAFDPRTSPYYKVILISISRDAIKTYHFSIYSSETENWRKLDYTPKHPHTLFGSSLGNFFNGAIIWLERLRIRTSSYFHINQESVNTVLPPYPPLSSHPGHYYVMKKFGGCGGNLYLVFSHQRDSVVDVYALNKDFSRWVYKFKVDFDAIAYEHPQILQRDHNNEKFYVCCLVCILDKEESIVICIGNELISYNFIDKTTKKLCNIKEDRRRMKAAVSCSGTVCTESLFGV